MRWGWDFVFNRLQRYSGREVVDDDKWMSYVVGSWSYPGRMQTLNQGGRVAYIRS